MQIKCIRKTSRKSDGHLLPFARRTRLAIGTFAGMLGTLSTHSLPHTLHRESGPNPGKSRRRKEAWTRY